MNNQLMDQFATAYQNEYAQKPGKMNAMKTNLNPLGGSDIEQNDVIMTGSNSVQPNGKGMMQFFQK